MAGSGKEHKKMFSVISRHLSRSAIKPALKIMCCCTWRM